MNNTSALIENVKKGGRNVNVDISELAGMGMSIVPDVISAIRSGNLGAARNLATVLLKVDTPEMVPIAIDLLDEKNNTLRLTAFQILGRVNSEQAFQSLINELLDKENIISDRAWAADVLGEMGDQRAVHKLLPIVKNIVDEEQIHYHADLVIACIVALAKLGNQEMSPYIIELSHANDTIIRLKAIKALKYIVTPGIFSTLQAAAKDNLVEICKDAMDTLFYLGTREAVDEFITLLENENTDISNTAFFRIYDITGKLFDEDAQVVDVKVWWKEHRDDYKTGVCYRLGKPLRLSNIISLMTEQPTWRNVLVEELRIITGHTFGLNPFIHLSYQDLNSVTEHAQNWWEHESHRFEPGALYKYGHKQDTMCAMER